MEYQTRLIGRNTGRGGRENEGGTNSLGRLREGKREGGSEGRKEGGGE